MLYQLFHDFELYRILLFIFLLSPIVSPCIPFMLNSLYKIIFNVLNSFHFGAIESYLSVSNLIDNTRDLFLVAIDIIVTFFLDLYFLMVKFISFKLFYKIGIHQVRN